MSWKTVVENLCLTAFLFAYLLMMIAGGALFFVSIIGPIFYGAGVANGGYPTDFYTWEYNAAIIGGCFGFFAAFTA